MKVIFLQFSLLLLLSGCHKRTDCPAVSEDYLEWFPQSATNNFSFTDGQEMIRMSVKEFVKSAAYTIKQPLFVKQPCEARANISLSDNLNNQEIAFDCNYFSGPDIESEKVHCSVSFYNSETSHFSFGYVDGFLSVYDFTNLRLVNNFNNGYQTYPQALKLEVDTLKDDQPIYVAYLVKSIGVVQFTDRHNKKTWNYVESQ